MAFSAGVFSRLYNWTTDKTNGVKIRADRMDAEFDGIAAGLSSAILKDGTQTITADIPFSARKITGLGDASAAKDAMNRDASDARYLRHAGANVAADIAMGTYKITGLGDAGAAKDAMNRDASDARYAQLSGATMTGGLILPAAATGLSPFRVPHGTAPTSPVDGDFWSTSAGFYARVNGATIGPLASGGPNWSLIQSQTVSVPVATVDFTTGLTAFDDVIVQFSGVTHASASARQITAAISSNGGSTWSSAVNVGGTFFTGVTVRGHTVIGARGLNATNIRGGSITSVSADPTVFGLTLDQAISTSGGVNALRLALTSSENFTGGTFELYGR